MTNIYREARTARPMTQEELAMAADVSVRTIRRLENGEAVGAESRRAVAAVLGMFDTLPPEQFVRKHKSEGAVLHGKGTVEEGITLYEFTFLLRAVAFMMLALCGTLQLAADIAGTTIYLWKIMGPLVMWSGVPAIIGGSVGMFYYLSRYYSAKWKLVPIELVLERTGAVQVSDAVADVLAEHRTGNYRLSMDDRNASEARMVLNLPLDEPSVLRDVAADLRRLGIVPTRAPVKKTFSTSSGFASEYL